jgi:Putative beta barrel porin-7 (BBP7)
VLFGQNPLTFGNPTSGVRAMAGLWLDSDNSFSMDMGGIVLPRQFNKFSITANPFTGVPLIGRPYFDTALGTEAALLTSAPAGTFASPTPLFTGTTSVVASQQLWGLDLNARYHTYIGRYLHAELLAGVRYLRLIEDLSISDQITILTPGSIAFLGTPIGVPGQIADNDFFRTGNEFIGLQAGGRLGWDFGRFFINLDGKVAVGANQEQVLISGYTFVSSATVSGLAPGALLTEPSNIGNYHRTVVSAVPEVGFTGGVNLTSWCRLWAGYNFLYWGNVVRPGDQIDRNVNGTQIPTVGTGVITGVARPLFTFRPSDFWVQYINLGLELHF